MEDKTEDYPIDIFGQLVHFMYTKWDVSDELIKFTFPIKKKK